MHLKHSGHADRERPCGRNELNGTHHGAKLGWADGQAAKDSNRLQLLFAREGLTAKAIRGRGGIVSVGPQPNPWPAGRHLMKVTGGGPGWMPRIDQGYVTSSCYSAQLANAIALAFLKTEPTLGERMRVGSAP